VGLDLFSPYCPCTLWQIFRNADVVSLLASESRNRSHLQTYHYILCSKHLAKLEKYVRMCVSSCTEHVIETRIFTAAQFLLYMLDRQPTALTRDCRPLIREAVSLTDQLIEECMQTESTPTDVPTPGSGSASLDTAIERAAARSAAAHFADRLDRQRTHTHGPSWYRRPGTTSTCHPDKTTLN
jgi:hypothetical protein